ncbi:hypothetical protein GPECTOR_12g418 [Gonium pectorale]|uniref:HAT C-terminal dimerisation domain-containing protein n=1 Tax=Gonium pectorale TaxID=33097 RepID=A0A150GNU4_GONPE|nr:hypothetical protein GPECTOR_12g418 [Gonium pectorale]|eukprot:KXZ51455.1 hypothetical protein GPECTOR_12g418 [Gonium pectorale]
MPPPSAPPPVDGAGGAGSDDEYAPGDDDYESDTSDYDERDPRSERKHFDTVYENLTDFSTLGFLHLMCDALVQTDAMFKFMQCEQFKFSEVNNVVDTVRTVINESFVTVQPGKYVTPALSSFMQEMAATKFVSYKGHTLTGVPPNPTAALHSLVKEYAQGLIVRLGERFPDSKFLTALAMFDPAEYPENGDDPEVREAWLLKRFEEVRKYFAEREAARVHEHPCYPEIDFDAARAELSAFGSAMWKRRAQALADKQKYVEHYVKQRQLLQALADGYFSLIDGEAMEAMEAAAEEARSRRGPAPDHHVNLAMEQLCGGKLFYPNLWKLALFCVLIKPTSVMCERVFSARTALKTCRRARLSAFRLAQGLFIKMNTSGSLVKESVMLGEAMEKYKDGRRMHIYTAVAERVENALRDPRFSRL